MRVSLEVHAHAAECAVLCRLWLNRFRAHASDAVRLNPFWAVRRAHLHSTVEAEVHGLPGVEHCGLPLTVYEDFDWTRWDQLLGDWLGRERGSG